MVGFTAEGCLDTDNQYRAAIGRYAKDSKFNKIVFGKGQERIGLYDSNCVISNKQVTSDGRIIFSARCTGEEGKRFNGAVILKMENEISMRMITPLTRKDGTLLHRCLKETAERAE